MTATEMERMDMDHEPEERIRFLVPMTTSQLARAVGMARRTAANDDDDLAVLTDGGADALHVETDTDEGVTVRLARGADEAALRSRIEAVGGRRDLPDAA